jgi:hypothetical protein
MGYVAGASDMLHVVRSLNVNSTTLLDFRLTNARVINQSNCLWDRSEGNLGQFTTWAESLFLGKNTQAASILFDSACK